VGVEGTRIAVVKSPGTACWTDRLTAHDQALSQLVTDDVDAQGFTFTPTGKRELIDALLP
jgi:hypothetical protein